MSFTSTFSASEPSRSTCTRSAIRKTSSRRWRSLCPLAAGSITLELDPTHAALAQRHIDASPYADRVEIRVGPALGSVRSLQGPFDLVFIDADKPGDIHYYEAVLPLLSPHGLIVVDNVLWSGRVLDAASADADTAAIIAFNEHVAADPRVAPVMLTLRDGVTLIRLRG